MYTCGRCFLFLYNFFGSTMDFYSQNLSGCVGQGACHLTSFVLKCVVFELEYRIIGRILIHTPNPWQC